MGTKTQTSETTTVKKRNLQNDVPFGQFLVDSMSGEVIAIVRATRRSRLDKSIEEHGYTIVSESSYRNDSWMDRVVIR